MDLENIRRNYKKSMINFQALDDDPIVFFKKWLIEALDVDKFEANACVLSTMSADHKPSSRVVLLKEVRDNGFVFYTSYKSNKSVDIQNNNNVALNFYWPKLEKQVRVSGEAIKLSSKDSDEYFRTRPRGSQLAACMSHQSAEISIDYDFDASLSVLKNKFIDREVDRPDDWGGFCVNANEIEFWQGRPSRFHDRVLYVLSEDKWRRKRLSP